jgi:tetratricopeptide (TPR) repeat protein
MSDSLPPIWSPYPNVGSADDVIDVKSLVQEARAVHALKKWRDAAAIWARVRQEAPAEISGYTFGGEALLEAKEFVEADAVLSAGARRFPHNSGLGVNYAWSAHRRRDWQEAVQRWASTRDSFPSEPLAYVVGSAALMAMGRFAEAEAVLLPALERFPNNLDVRINLGWVANRSKRWREAEARWRRLYSDHPDSDQICTGLAEALLALRQFDEAKPIIEKARQKRPNDPYNTVIEARIAVAQGRWGEAVANLTSAQLNHPNDNGIRMILNEAKMRALLDQDDNDPPPPQARLSTAAPTASDSTSRLREIFGQFEAIGSTCEFGLVQRHFGAEPLGLLRWSVLDAQQLINVLQKQFEGVGEPENTTLKVVNREWYTEDKNFGMGMHTFILENEEPSERMFPKFCKRIQFLRRKLMTDLRDAEKILVYKSEERLPDDKIVSVFSEVRSYGDNTLLVVMLASDEHKAGTVRELDDGLMVGYVSRYFNPKPEIHDWLRVSLKAHALWSTRSLYRSQ